MKESFYFSHDYNSRNDRKLVALFKKHKVGGIGIFWCIVEMLYEEDGSLLLSECERIAFELRVKKQLIESVINDFHLFKNDGIKFWSESVNKRLHKRNDKTVKARESANLRWKNANALRPQSEGNAIKESKVKEIKGNIVIEKNLNGELVGLEISNSIEYCDRTFQRKYSPEQIQNLWKGFLINGAKKYYSDRQEKVTHFGNWIKFQPYKPKEEQNYFTGGPPLKPLN